MGALGQELESLSLDQSPQLFVVYEESVEGFYGNKGQSSSIIDLGVDTYGMVCRLSGAKLVHRSDSQHLEHQWFINCTTGPKYLDQVLEDMVYFERNRSSISLNTGFIFEILKSYFLYVHSFGRNIEHSHNCVVFWISRGTCLLREFCSK